MHINPHNYETLIGINEEVLAALTGRATPFIDDPNAVVRRLVGLDVDRAPGRNGQASAIPDALNQLKSQRSAVARKTKVSKKPPRPPRAPKGSLTPELQFEQPILQALNEAGGSLPTREAMAAVGTLMADVLNEHDRFRDDKGVARWEKRVPFVRLKLVERGLLDPDAPRGVWQLSDAGRDALTRATS